MTGVLTAPIISATSVTSGTLTSTGGVGASGNVAGNDFVYVSPKNTTRSIDIADGIGDVHATFVGMNGDPGWTHYWGLITGGSSIATVTVPLAVPAGAGLIHVKGMINQDASNNITLRVWKVTANFSTVAWSIAQLGTVAQASGTGLVGRRC
jgi:hypothetical protein